MIQFWKIYFEANKNSKGARLSFFNKKQDLNIPLEFSSFILKPVAQYTASGEEVFKTGNLLIIAFRATARGAFFSHKFSVTVTIKEINANGTAQLETTEGEIEAQQLFTTWRGGGGTNYVPLDFSSDLTADKLTILGINKL